jgi:hypothetical protein
MPGVAVQCDRCSSAPLDRPWSRDAYCTCTVLGKVWLLRIRLIMSQRARCSHSHRAAPVDGDVEMRPVHVDAGGGARRSLRHCSRRVRACQRQRLNNDCSSSSWGRRGRQLNTCGGVDERRVECLHTGPGAGAGVEPLAEVPVREFTHAKDDMRGGWYWLRKSKGGGSRAEGRTAAPAYAVQWLAALSHTNLHTTSQRAAGGNRTVTGGEQRAHDCVRHMQKNFDVGGGSEYLRSVSSWTTAAWDSS